MMKVPKLISLDVGGTIGTVKGKGITEILSVHSPLPNHKVRQILRNSLHIAPYVTETVILEVCERLKIPRSAFPDDYKSPSFRLYRDSSAAIKTLGKIAPLVTLSNVCSLDFDSDSTQSIPELEFIERYASCKLGFAKPDCAAFQKIAERHGIPITSLFHIGDDWECDVLGALSAGAQVIWISRNRCAPLSAKSAFALERLAISEDISTAAALLSRWNGGEK